MDVLSLEESQDITFDLNFLIDFEKKETVMDKIYTYKDGIKKRIVLYRVTTKNDSNNRVLTYYNCFVSKVLVQDDGTQKAKCFYIASNRDELLDRKDLKLNISKESSNSKIIFKNKYIGDCDGYSFFLNFKDTDGNILHNNSIVECEDLMKNVL